MARTYICPMHGEIRQSDPGRCPQCGMYRIADGTPFTMLWHIASNPTQIVFMTAVMVAIMAAMMMMVR
jgi:Heavy metal binding domain